MTNHSQFFFRQGYNRWRDAMKPTQILAKLCKDGKLDPPVYEYGRVKIGRTVFNMHMEDTELFSNPDTVEEQMALLVLRRWQEVPRVGTRLVTEHVETRPLYNPSKPGKGNIIDRLDSVNSDSHTKAMLK